MSGIAFAGVPVDTSLTAKSDSTNIIRINNEGNDYTGEYVLGTSYAGKEVTVRIGKSVKDIIDEIDNTTSQSYSIISSTGTEKTGVTTITAGDRLIITGEDGVSTSVYKIWTTIDMTSLSDWDYVTSYLDDIYEDGSKNELVKYYISNDDDYLYTRIDVSLFYNGKSNLGTAFSTGTAGSLDAMVWIEFGETAAAVSDSSSVIDVNVVDAYTIEKISGTAAELGLDVSNLYCFVNGDITSIVVKVPFSGFADSSIDLEGINNNSITPMWAQTNASQQPTATMKDRIPDTGYFNYNTSNGGSFIVDSGLSSENDILTYTIPNQSGSTTIDNLAGTIGVTVPAGTDVTDLIASFTASEGVKAVQVSGTLQSSGSTTNDFTSDVIYVVTAEDGTTKTWTVTITVDVPSDTTAPTADTFTPADEATNVAINADLVITFDEAVNAGTGNIVIYDGSGNVVETIAVTSDLVTGTGTDTITIKPTDDLDGSTDYYVMIADGAIVDTSGNPYVGIDNDSTWNFTTETIVIPDTTAPTADTFTPADEATNVAINADLVITFDEAVNAGTGNIVIYDGSGNVVETIAVTSDRVTGTGTDTITIKPTDDLDGSTDYYVMIADGAIVDTSGNPYAGIDNDSTWNFTTEYLANNGIDGFVTSIKTGEGLIAANVVIKDVAGNTISETVTASDGRYEFTGLKDNEYIVEASMINFSSASSHVRVSDGDVATKDFTLAEFKIELISTPNIIVANGEDVSELKVLVTDLNGDPVEGMTVTFEADGDIGYFDNGYTAVTDIDGQAIVPYRSEKLGGTTIQYIPITAKVKDPETGLNAESTIYMTYAPGSVKGVVIDNATGEPISNATVTVIKDFDGDGVVDFYAVVTTDETGAYKIPIPVGNEVYDLFIEEPIVINGESQIIVFHQKVSVGEVSGEGYEIYDSHETAAGVILVGDSENKENAKQFNDYSRIELEIVGASEMDVVPEIQLNDDGTYFVTNIEIGKVYQMNVYYEIESGVRIIIGTIELEVGENGEINISSSLVDPYGIIKDSESNETIEDVLVKLYYADTQRNLDEGHIIIDDFDSENNYEPKLVVLPVLNDFPPNNNANPQYSDSSGNYAYMVYPNSDYYIVATKDGYDTHTSETISVENTIIEYNIDLDPIQSGGSSGSSGSTSGTTDITDETLGEDAPIHTRYIKGFPDGKFYPAEKITRAQVATIFARILNLEENVDNENVFEDVPLTHWASGYIEVVYDAGLVIGYDDGEFKPERNITREEFATIISRYIELYGAENEIVQMSILDDIGETWGQEYIQNAYSREIMIGYPDGTFLPKQSITREESVTAINRLISRGPLMVESSHWPDVEDDRWSKDHIEEASRTHEFEVFEEMEKPLRFIEDLLW
jgi:methionine-rich copper-binding protein CopC